MLLTDGGPSRSFNVMSDRPVNLGIAVSFYAAVQKFIRLVLMREASALTTHK